MIQVERHHIQGSEEIRRLCRASKELYDKCNYHLRQAWLNSQPLPDLGSLVKLTQNEECFRNLHNTKTAKQTIRKVISDWSNFRKALGAYKKSPSKFLRRPKPPGYKRGQHAQVVFYDETIKQKLRRAGILSPTNGCFSVRSDRPFKQVVITPKRWGFIVEVQYEVDHKAKKAKGDSVCCIDIGLNNLAAITSDKHSPILVNGRVMKTINQWFNKRVCKKRSRKRYFRIENYFHHVSKMIVQNCVQHGISTIIIGKNDGWKTRSKFKKKSPTSQNFQSVPFARLLEKIKQKADVEGVEVIFTEEAYTSQASYLDRDPIPAYKRKQAKPEFSGSRIKRGLYRDASGVLLNADVNGSANIGRKVIQNEDTLLRLDRSLAARPVVVNPLQVFA